MNINMKKDKILTISVAAYNLENLIEQNLESFAKCKNKDLLEVIITDDGSKDKTADVVQKYVDKYPDTFKLIKQKNAGAGSTVNSGLRNATGKFFKMIDGDDWVVSENLDILLEKLKISNADMVLTNIQVYNEELKRITSYEKTTVSPGTDIEFKNVCKDLHLDMHYVAYRTAILKDNNIVLDNGYYTDTEYLLLPVPFINKIDAYDLDIYIYRIARAGQSVSIESRQKHIDMHDLVLKRLIKYYEENNNELNNNSKLYMANRIAGMEDLQLGTILSFKDDKDKKQKIRNYNEEIKNLSPDIYKIYSKKIKCSILLHSNYLLTNILAKIYLKKNAR